jgi:hypothetical protein
MRETFSDDFKKLFLIKFTEELIRHSEEIDLRKLEGIIVLKEKKKFARKKFPAISSGVTFSTERIPARRQKRNFIILKETAKPSLFIPESKLPEHLEYLKPMPTAGVEIDLWKLNPVIKDRAVRVIEVNPDEKVIVTGAMGTKPTNIILNKEDIDRVINEFSKASKIPVEEGVYRVVVGNLILSAVISEVIGSKFIIRKMTVPPKQNSAPPQIRR